MKKQDFLVPIKNRIALSRLPENHHQIRLRKIHNNFCFFSQKKPWKLFLYKKFP